MTKKRNYKQIQLYTLFDTLSHYIYNQDELGTIVGYSVLDGLFKFKSQSGSKQERKFQEIKSVYNSLDYVITSCKDSTSYIALCKFQSNLDPIIQKYISGERTKLSESYLLKKVLREEIYPKRKNHVDILRRDGLKLYKGIIERGALMGNHNILTKDYNNIEEAFNLK
ncbi:hypothetical protein ISS04_01955 [Candidatus Woesearchaeota archaeon]|nr:hypothetical protein [Candidatus Woesearchaeota archaeon]